MDDTKLAFNSTATAWLFGPGGSVNASFLCATPEKAEALVKVLQAMAQDDCPEWAKPPKQPC